MNRPIAETHGKISLSQEADGGGSLGGPGARGGDARSELTLERFEGAGLSLTASAGGGPIYVQNEGDGARGGDAVVVVEGIDHAGAPVEVNGFAGGGFTFGPNSQGGSATLQSVVGRSTAGGSVTVNGVAQAGRGSFSGSMDLDDVVEGDTSGALSISQSA